MSQDMESKVNKEQVMLEILFDRNPDGVCLSDAQGTLTANPAAEALLPPPQKVPHDIGFDKWQAAYGLYMADGKTPHATETLPLVRALRGDTVREYEPVCRNPSTPEGIYLSVSASPLPDGGALCVFRDVSERKRLEEDLAKRNEELAQQMRDNAQLIERLRLAVDELSTPVLELWDDVLALPVVGVVDTVRSSRMMEKVLAEVVVRRCRFVIIDLTGVDVIDTSTADRFLKLARSVELLGAQCIISGVQPAVAQTLTDLGVSFRGLVTQRNLKRALDFCIGKKQEGSHRASA